MEKFAVIGRNGYDDRYRHEFKYLCRENDLMALKQRLLCVMSPDKHAGQDGSYLIRSIYFDTHDDRFLEESRGGADLRQKWRIRTYNLSQNRITLECKSKECNMTRKTAVSLSRDEFDKIMSGKSFPPQRDYSPVLNQFLLTRSEELLKPKTIVQYQRYPFVCNLGNTRVTFDYSIASSVCFDRFFDRNCPVRPALPKGMQLLEVKYDAFLPDYIFQTIQMTDMRATSFSKYAICRQYRIGV